MLNNKNIILINTIADYLKYTPTLTNYSEIAIDIETYCLPQYKHKYSGADVHNASISTIQLLPKNSDTVLVYDIITLEKSADYSQYKNLLIETLQKIECSVIHSASFEIKFFKKYYGVLLNNTWCTRVASQLINNALGNKFNQAASSNGLASLCKDYLDIELTGKGTVQIEDWYPRPLTQEKIEYACNDVLYLSELKEIFLEILTKPFPEPDTYTDGLDWGLGMQNIVDIEMKFSAVEAECEYNGLPINSYLLKEFEDNLWDRDRESGYLMQLGGELAKELGLVYYIPMNLEVNYPIPTKKTMTTINSSQGLLELVNQHIGVATTAEGKVVSRILSIIEQLHTEQSSGSDVFYSKDEETLYKELMFLDDSEVLSRSRKAKLIVEYKSHYKQASMKLSKYINDATGRVHYRLNSLGASTGRCASSSPNSQNINAKVHLEIELLLSNLNRVLVANCKPACEL